MTVAEKKALRRKIKIYKKIKQDKLNQKELQKTGLTRADANLLKKNQNKIKKQIGDSKVERGKFTRNSQFFQNFGQNK